MSKKTIQNPVIRGFNPDPSICRVGDDYYVACSTFEYFPGIQIHHSRDLRHWRLLTRALDSVRLVNLRNCDNGCGVWAPQLTWANGRFYLIFANVLGVGGPITDAPNYLVTSTSIEGPWSDPVFLRAGGFDPSLFHDSDGAIYYVNMQMGEPGGGRRFDGIWLQRYDPEAHRLTGPFRKIWDGTPLRVTEGPHLYRRDGWYYLFAAEGGTGWTHAVSVARSRELFGPYETMPGNPLLTSADAPDSPLQSAGHADFAETPDGGIYLVHLTERPMGERVIDGQTTRVVPLGRETCIQKLEWPCGGWPRLAGGGTRPRMEVPAPDLPDCPFPPVPARTDFRKGTLPVDFITLREPLTSAWAEFTAEGLRLRGGDSLNGRLHQSWVGRRLQHDRVRVETRMRFSPPTFRETAGLIFQYDRMNFLYLRVAGVDDGNGKTDRVKIGVVASDNGTVTRFDAENFAPDVTDFRLRIELDGKMYRFYYAVSEEDWKRVECVFPITFLGDHASRFCCFTGTMAAVCAQSVSGMEIFADFEYFEYRECSDNEPIQTEE